MRPRMRVEPTPFASPAKLWSTRDMRPHRCAHAIDITVTFFFKVTTDQEDFHENFEHEKLSCAQSVYDGEFSTQMWAGGCLRSATATKNGLRTHLSARVDEGVNVVVSNSALNSQHWHVGTSSRNRKIENGEKGASVL